MSQIRFNVKTENCSFEHQEVDCQDSSLNSCCTKRLTVLQGVGIETAGMEAVGAGRHFYDKLADVLCMHVDDVLLGWNGAAYRASVDSLRA